MKITSENHKKNVYVVNVLLLVTSIALFITSCIIRRYYNGAGSGWALVSFLIIGIMMITEFTDERKMLLGLGIVMIYALIFSCVKFRYYPTVTEYTQFRSSLYELKDNRVFCSYTDSTSVFTTISNDTIITRSSKCIVCNKYYDKHFTSKPTKNQCTTDEVLKWWILTPQNL